MVKNTELKNITEVHGVLICHNYVSIGYDWYSLSACVCMCVTFKGNQIKYSSWWLDL